MPQTLLSVSNLTVSFKTDDAFFIVVDDVSFDIHRGEVVGLVGESGCGKSVSALSLLRLIPSPPGSIENGKVLFKGNDLLKAGMKTVHKVRGQEISMIFQEPMTSLNPVFTVGAQIAEVFITHEKLGKKEAFARAAELLNLVKIPDPVKRAKSYPHQLSGGMRQRAMIAMALASPEPGLMIADEPTTALDVTIQAQILQLLSELKERVGMALLLITHDMGVVAETADRVVVMYAGRKVEDAPVEDLFANPRHPYTAGLLGCQCSAPSNRNAARLTSINGSVPDLLTLGEGCPFVNRCDNVKDECMESFPDISKAGEEHEFRCHNPIPVSGASI